MAAGIYKEIWGLPVADEAVRQQVSTSSNLLLVLQDSLWHLGLQGPTAAASSNPPASPAPTSSSDQNAAVPRFLSKLRLPEPTLMSTNPLTFGSSGVYELSQACLMAKAARRAGVQALALTGPYLPSQLAVLQAAASSGAMCVLAGSQGLHIVLLAATGGGAAANAAASAVGGHTGSMPSRQQQQQQNDLQQRLGALLGRTTVLPEAWLAAARAAETSLGEQLRLLSPAAWSGACQHLLRRQLPEDVAVGVGTLAKKETLESSSSIRV